MKATEKKLVCDLISTIANAIATDTIPEAEDYIIDRFNTENDLVNHSLSILTTIYNRQTI